MEKIVTFMRGRGEQKKRSEMKMQRRRDEVGP